MKVALTGHKVRRAIFPVAGLGTRFLPATKATTKEMLTLIDRPLIDYAVREALEAGIEEFIFVTSRGKSALEEYFDNSPLLEAKLEAEEKWELLEELRNTNLVNHGIYYVQQPQALGLGHAVLCAKEYLSDNEPFAVILPDDLIHAPVGALRQMVEAYESVGGCLVAAMAVPNNEVSSYGIIDPIQDGERITSARRLIEKPTISEAPSNLAIVGRYILTPSVLDTLKHQCPGSGGEIQLTDAISAEIAAGRKVAGFRFHGERFDCGSKLGYLEATLAMALQEKDLRYQLLARLEPYIRTLAAE